MLDLRERNSVIRKDFDLCSCVLCHPDVTLFTEKIVKLRL